VFFFLFFSSKVSFPHFYECVFWGLIFGKNFENMYIKLEIPMPSYLKKFLDVELGADYVVSRKDYIAKVLLADIEGKQKKISKPVKNAGELYFSVRLSVDYIYRYQKATIGLQGVAEFVDYADKLFKRNMCLFVDSRYSLKDEAGEKQVQKNLLSAEKAIKDFLGKYAVAEDDFKLESAIKYYRRYSKAQKERHIKQAM